MKAGNLSKSKFSGIAVLAICAATAASARADILFDDYGPGYTYNVGLGYDISGAASFPGPAATAMEFTPLETGTVSSVAFGLSLAEGTNSVTMDLMTDSGGSPGSIIESYNFVSQLELFGVQNAPLTALSPTNPILTAGTNYWMVGFPGASDTFAVWNVNDQSVAGDDQYSSDGGATWTDSGTQTMGAFEVLSVPEPASLGLLGLGSLLLISRRRKAARG